MKAHPLLFSAPMVRALLDGSKTQTRRALKPQPYQIDGLANFWNASGAVGGRICGSDRELLDLHRTARAGDLIWVREAWSGRHAFRDTPPSERALFTTPDGPILREDVWYWADGNPDGGDYERPRPSIHMPRYASRLTLAVTDIRVERLQEISEADALAEGVPTDDHYIGSGDETYCGHCRGFGVHAAFGTGYGVTEVDCRECDTAKLRYRNLWESINGPGSWNTNPWVVAYTFRVIPANVDAVLADPARYGIGGAA